MSEAQGSVTPLTEVMEEVHGGDEESFLRERYAEFIPCEAVPKKKRRYELNPGRPASKSDYNEERDGQQFRDGAADGTMLHGVKPPPVIIQQERPEHRFLIFLYSQGMSTKDVYIQMGGEWDSARNAPVSGTGQYSYQHLHTIRRQAWFQTKLVEYMEECGKDLIRAKLESELMPSIDTVIRIRDDKEAPKNVQLSAANSLIDRFLGKATVHIQAEDPSSVARYEKEAKELEAERRTLEAQINALNPSFLGS